MAFIVVLALLSVTLWILCETLCNKKNYTENHGEDTENHGEKNSSYVITFFSIGLNSGHYELRKDSWVRSS